MAKHYVETQEGIALKKKGEGWLHKDIAVTLHKNTELAAILGRELLETQPNHLEEVQR